MNASPGPEIESNTSDRAAERTPASARVPAEVEVLVAGAGPCGLMLAIELGRRGIRTLVVDPRQGTAFSPQANATQARTMEHYRRLGFAEEVRALGLPNDYPTDIAYFTRYARHELARFSLPAADAARRLARELGGSWSAAELPHRVSQKFVEPVLFKHARACATVELRHGWRLDSFVDAGTHVQAQLAAADGGAPATVRAAFLVAADGARSPTRRALGIEFQGEAERTREFMGGKMFAAYLHAPGFYDAVPHARAWMYWAINPERRAFMAAVDGRGEFAFHTQLAAGERIEGDLAAAALARFHEAVGQPVPATVLACDFWTAGRTLVVPRMRSGRVFLGGDAAHLFTPAGGLGYNTAIEDAVNLGWKLAAVLRGGGGERLLDSYDVERRHAAERNTAYARRFADSLGLFACPPEIEQESEAGRDARERTGEHYDRHARIEFDIPGVTFGSRYDGSPVIAADGTTPPPDLPNVYEPTACPGGRAPHRWLADGRSLYDHFGFHWTLLCLEDDIDASAFVAAAEATEALVLNVVGIADEADRAALRALYAAPLALVRPDQVVAWRGDAQADANALFARVLGRSAHV